MTSFTVWGQRSVPSSLGCLVIVSSSNPSQQYFYLHCFSSLPGRFLSVVHDRIEVLPPGGERAFHHAPPSLFAGMRTELVR